MSTTRESGAIIGNGLKTIVSRITTMSEAETALNGVNISIKDMQGNIKPVSDIITELSGKWGTLSDEQRQNLGVTLAGRYQLSRFLALMNNFELATEATSTALNSQGSAMREQAKYADSLEARINRLDTAWNKLTLSAGTAFLTDGIIATVETLNDLASGVTFMIDKIGVLSGVFGTLGAVTVLLSTRFRTFTTSLIFGTQGMTRASLATAGLTAGMGRLGIATVGAKVALQGLLASTIVGAAFVAIGFAVEKLISAYSEAKQKQEEFEESQKKNIDALTNNKKQTEELIATYKNLSEQQGKTGWDTEKEKEYLQVQQQLGDLFPSLISQIDATGQTHLIAADRIDKEIEATKELLELKKEEIRLKALETFEDNIDKRDGFFGLEKDIERKRKQIEDSIKVGVKATDVNKLRQELNRMESELASTSLKINDHVLKVAEAYAKLEVDPTIKKSVQDLVSSLDLTDLNATELEAYSMEVANLMDNMQKTYDNGDSKGFDGAKKALLDYVDSMGATDVQASVLGVTFDKVKENADRLANSTYGGADGMDAFSESMENASEQSKDFAEQFDDAVSKIESLNGIINELNDGEGVSADSISTLIESYPELLEYINDEATLRSKIKEEIDKEAKVAKRAMVEKLKYSETFYINTLKNNKTFVEQLNKTYGVDLTAYKDLNSAKIAVDNATRERLSKAWETFYKNIANAARASSDGMEVMTGALMNRAQNIMAEQTRVSTDFNEIFLDQVEIITDGTIAQSGLSDSTRKSAKEYENAIFISDKFKQATERLNLELEKQRKIQATFPKHSQEYQKSLKSEISLLDQKKKLLQDQTKALDAQIKSGKIAQTGIVTTKASSSSYSPASSSYASGGSNSAQIWNFFKSKGFTDNIVAGIMGNLQLESGLNPNALNKSSGAFGVAQWLGSRKKSLQSYANAVGTSMNDLSTQLNFLWKELNSTEKRTLNYLNGNRGASASSIAAAFDRLFERSEGTHIPQRQKYANQFLNQYAGTAGSKQSSEASKAVAENLQNIDEAKSDLLQLQQDSLSISEEIQRLQLELIKTPLYQAENRFRQIDSQMKIYDARLEKQDELSKEYRTNLQNQIILLKEKKKLTEQNMVYIERELETNKSLTQIQRDELQQTYLDLRDSLVDIDNSIVGFMNSHLNSALDALNKRFDDSFKKINDELESIEHSMKLLDESDSRQLGLMDKKVDNLNKQREEIENNIKLLQSQTKNLQNNHEALEKNTQEIEKWEDALREVDLQIIQTQKDLQSKMSSIFQEQRDAYFDGIKKDYDAQRKYLEKQIEDAEDYYEPLIEAKQEQLKLLDEEYEKEDRIKRLRELNDEIDNVKSDKRFSYITEQGEEILTFDKERVSELEKQRDELLQQYQREDIKKAIQDDIDRLEKAKEDRLEVLRQQLEDIQENYDLLVEEQEKLWDELLKSAEDGTLNFDELMNGWYGSSLGTLAQFGSDVATQVENIKSIFASLADLKVPDVKMPSVGGSGGSTTKTFASPEEERAYRANNPNDPYTVAKDTRHINLLEEKGMENWTAADKADYEKLIKRQGLDKKHDGGIVGNVRPNRLTELANKLFNVQPNEEVIKSLKGELQVPPKNIPNLFTNIKNLANSIIPKQSESVVNQKHYHLNNFTIKTDDATQLFNSIDFLIQSEQ